MIKPSYFEWVKRVKVRVAHSPEYHDHTESLSDKRDRAVETLGVETQKQHIGNPLTTFYGITLKITPN
jgi:hypothetical protein